MIDLVVLSAGRGRRLGPLGDRLPKWLLDVGGVTPAERQMEAVERASSHSPGVVRSILVVAGHAAAAIASFVARHDGPRIRLVDNPAYDELNNWYSLLLALRDLDERDETGTVVVFNADLFATADWFARFLIDSADATNESLIAVDIAKPLTEESMKVAAIEGEPKVLDRIGKEGVDDPIGEYVGMHMARGSARARLRSALESYVGSKADADNWYERAIGQTASDGVPWALWPTPDSKWIEIDDAADLESARQLDL